MNDNLKKRIDWLDIAKGITIFCIVLGHIVENKIIYTILYSFHLPIFMFISGYLYKKRKIGEFAKRKFKSVMVPYLFFGILEILYFYMFEVNYREYTPIKESFLGLITGNYDWLDFNTHLWYLPFFFMVSNIYNILENIFDNDRIPRIIFLIIAVLGIFIKIPNLPFSINRFELMAYFALGDFISSKVDLDKAFSKCERKKLKMCSLISFIVVITMNICKANKFGLEYIIGTLGINGILMVSYLLNNKSKVMTDVGKDTLVILCIHGPIYRVIIKVISILFKISTDIIRKSVLLSSGIAILDIAICLIIYKLLEKTIPWSIGKNKIRNKRK